MRERGRETSSSNGVSKRSDKDTNTYERVLEEKPSKNGRRPFFSPPVRDKNGSIYSVTLTPVCNARVFEYNRINLCNQCLRCLRVTHYLEIFMHISVSPQASPSSAGRKLIFFFSLRISNSHLRAPKKNVVAPSKTH